MSLFLSYIDYYNKGGLDQIKYDLIEFLLDFFDPKNGDKYFFMDPILM